MCQSTGGIGASCSSDVQCGAGHCVDGVCCNTGGTACPLCQSCNVTGSAGTCTFVGTGVAEPHGACMPNGACGNTGLCAANQSCAKAAPGTSCGATASCSACLQTSAQTCDGAGTCSPATVTACDPFVCDVTTCKTKCLSDLDCIPGDYCDPTTHCQTKKTPGSACGSTAECATGVCGAEGVCCDTACNGTCQTCKLPTSPGTCSPDPTCPLSVDAGTDGG